MKKRIHFMITSFRDGFQSVYGARVCTKDFLPAVEAAVAAGMTHFEAGGGARFQSLYFYCNEDAFAMMDSFREVAGPAANLQTLARGINVVGLDSQPSDIIRLHAELFKKHGVTTIRNFDALNDVNNLIYSGQCIVDAQLRHEVCISMMGLPPGCTGAHTPEFYMGALRQILASGLPFHSVCFKDASGTSPPAVVYETVRQARQLLGQDAHLVFHSHETAGTGVLCYKAAIEAGISQIDLSMAPVSGGTCQPDVLTMWQALRGTDYDLGIDVEKVVEAEEVFKVCMADYFLPPEATMVEPLIPFFPMPGGALTANTQMLRDNGLLDRYPEVMAAMGETVTRGGFGTSVTPVSQFYFQQAFNNVLFGRWQRIAEGYGKMVLGYFGKTPTPPDPEVVRMASEQLGLPPTTELPLRMDDANPNKGTKAAEQALRAAGLPLTDENVFIAATCKEKGIAFLQGKAPMRVRKKRDHAEEAPAQALQGKAGASGDGDERAHPAPTASQVPETYTVRVNGETFSIRFEGEQAIVEGVPYTVEILPQTEGSEQEAAAPGEAGQGQAAAPGKGSLHEVTAPLPGIVLRLLAKAGEPIQSGAPILVLESMKMETQLSSPASGKLLRFAAAQGDQVQTGQLLAIVQE